MSVEQSRIRKDQDAPPPAELRWGVGCLVGGAALLGSLVFLVVLVFIVQTPAWIQIVLGTVLPLGSVLLAWLVASALRHPGRGSRSGE